MAALTLGLLCVLQATLNISLRLILYNDLTEKREKVEASYIKLQTSSTNLTEELKKEIGRLNERIRMLEERPCSQGWRKLGNNCYYTSTEKKNWTLSRQDCLSRGADLVVINSRDEQKFITGLAGFRSEVWIGLSDRETEGIWTWVDGTPLTTEYWMTGEPDNKGGNQNCVDLYYRGKGQLGEWFDERCSIKYKWICEK